MGTWSTRLLEAPRIKPHELIPEIKTTVQEAMASTLASPMPRKLRLSAELVLSAGRCRACEATHPLYIDINVDGLDSQL